MKRDTPLYMVLEMVDEGGSNYLVAPAEDDMINIYHGGNSNMKATLTFDNFCRFIFQYHINFRDEENGSILPAFTSLNTLMDDLKNETTATRIFHLESGMMFWYDSSMRTFVNDEGVFKAEEMDVGNYMYEPFVRKDAGYMPEGELGRAMRDTKGALPG